MPTGSARPRAHRPALRDGAYVVRTGHRYWRRIGLVVGIPVTAFLALMFGGMAAQRFAGGPLDGSDMAICTLISTGATFSLVVQARDIWFGNWADAVDRHGVWLPGLVAWPEIVEVWMGRPGCAWAQPDAGCRALLDGIDGFRLRHIGPSGGRTSGRLRATPLPELTMVTVALRPGASSEAAEIQGHLDDVERVQQEARGCLRRDLGVADELGALTDGVWTWRATRRFPRKHAYYRPGSMDPARFDAALRRFAPMVPIRQVDAPADGPAATPVQVAALLAGAARDYAERFATND